MFTHLLEFGFDFIDMTFVWINEMVLLSLENEVNLALEIYAKSIELG
jgi:hypothetical protein